MFFRKTLVLAMLLVSTSLAAQKNDDIPLRKLQIAEITVNNLYVDSVDEKKLVEDAIRGMIEKLDPHSSYMTAKEVKAANEPLQGNFEGIGIQFNVVEDTLLVIQTITGGPSEKKGVMAGDRVVSVNDTTIAGVKMPREEMVRRMRGPKGTKAVLGVVRRGVSDTLRFVITRDKIPLKSVDATYMIRPEVGYIRIGNFGAQTYDEFKESLASLLGQGMKTLVLDLQENGGGYLHAAVEIADELLADNELIVYTEGRRMRRHDYIATSGGMFETGRVIVLVDSYSASASEIVTGAIQDHDRGIVVGRRTFGKGLVQRIFDLPDGSVIRLTTAHYYTPVGRCIQKPYKKGNQRDYAMDLINRLKSGELTNADSIHFADSLRFFTLKEHRAVYGGGGIMPDYYVPLDTTKYTPFNRQLNAKSISINAYLRYVDNNRKQLKKKYPTFEKFHREYEIPQKLIDEIVAEAAKQKITPKDDEELQRTLPYLCNQLKALIARDLWSTTEYFVIINETSDIVNRALQLIDQQQ